MKLLTPAEVVQAIQDGKKVEFRYPNNDTWHELKTWKNLRLGKLLNSAWQFRIAQEMITVGDVSFPKPESEPLTHGTMYYIADLDNDNPYLNYVWRDTVFDDRMLKTGVVHLSKENAIVHAKALIKLSGGECE